MPKPHVTAGLLAALPLFACGASPAPCPTNPAPPSGADASRTATPRVPHTADQLFAAIRGGDGDSVDAILTDDPALASARSQRGASAILTAAFLLNPDQETFLKPSTNAMLHRLLRSGPPLDVYDAAVAGDTARLAALTRADPGVVNAPHPVAGVGPLHLAAFADRPAAISFLLAKGARVDAPSRNDFHNTPLVVAMLGDAVNAAGVLLASGADVELPEKGGFRALHIAAETGDARLVELLLDHKAQIDAKADDGTTPLGVATKKGREAIAKLLRSHGAT
jgi:ankyrin repeat protein